MAHSVFDWPGVFKAMVKTKLSIYAIVFCAAPLLIAPAWGAMYQCTDASGKISFADTPCKAGQTQLEKRADINPSPSCKPWAPREDILYPGFVKIYKLPEEKALLLCEIENTKQTISVLNGRRGEYSSQVGHSAAENAAIAGGSDKVQRALSNEERYLRELERQLQLGPDYAARRQRQAEYDSRCNFGGLSKASQTLQEFCRKEARELFGR